MKWEDIGIVVIFSSIGLLGYFCKKKQVINQSKDNVISRWSFSSGSSALAKYSSNSATTRTLVFDFCLFQEQLNSNSTVFFL